VLSEQQNGDCNEISIGKELLEKYVRVWMPFSTMGSLLCFASQGRVFFQVRFGDVPANRSLPMPPKEGLLAEPSWTAEETGRLEETFWDRSSS